MSLSESQKKFLRRLGHGLRPVVIVGEAGVSDALLGEFDAAIARHELIKARIRAADREARNAMIDELCRKGGAELVSRVGNVALLWRRNAETPRITLPA